MGSFIPAASWTQGAEEYRGKRLLPHIIDYHARENPDRVFAVIPQSNDIADGFRDVTMPVMATAINHMAWWIDQTCRHVLDGTPRDRVLAYIGPPDLRYSILLMAVIKCGSKVLFISPRNAPEHNRTLLQQAKVNVLLHADSLSAMAVQLRGSLPAVAVPLLTEMLDSKPEHYPFDGTFAELQNVACLILHSSGSTGLPKLVYLTHGTFACTDNDPSMPVPEGRRAQNAAQFDFSPPGRYYSCFPPFHLAGVQAFMLLPCFSRTATAVMGPSSQPPSGYLLNQICQQRSLRAIYAPPSIIEQWALEPNADEQAKGLDFVLYGGGPLAPAIGNRLRQVTDVCQMYGSLEMGQIQMLVPQGEWEYLEPNPYEECDMQEAQEGLYEMVLHQDERFRPRRSLSHTFPDVQTWRTRDLFTPHPTKPGLWRFHSRIDDMIVLSSSHKVWPIPFEQIMHGHPSVSGAVLVGNGRPEPVLIIEPRPGLEGPALLDEIWPSVVQANQDAPSYGKVRRSRIIFTEPRLGVRRTPKGTISRKPTEMLYAEQIEAVFRGGSSDQARTTITFDFHVLDAARSFVRTCVQDVLPGTTLQDGDNLFTAGGLDSLTAMELAQRLRSDLSQYSMVADDSVNAWLRLVMTHASIDQLAQTLWKTTALGPKSAKDADASALQTQQMQQILHDLHATLLEIPARSVLPLKVVLLGARGRLGPYLVRDLLADPRVESVWCLNRGPDGREAFQHRAQQLGLPVDATDPRLQFVSVDLSAPDLGLTAPQVRDILDPATTIIHNLWTVNFARPLASFTPDVLKSVCTIIDLAGRAAARPRIVFVSSIATVQRWQSSAPKGASSTAAIPETPVGGPDLIVPQGADQMTGYAQSKYIAESLFADAAARWKLDISILRLGQVAGSSDAASSERWESHDWIHSLVRLCRASRLIPADLGPLDWIPVDRMSRAMLDIALRPRSETIEGQASVFHLVHPRPIPFAPFAEAIRSSSGASKRPDFQEWVETLGKLPAGTLPADVEQERARILPFFASLVGKWLPSVDTSRARMASPTLASLRAIDGALLEKWCRDWV
ncbi:acetyl-CoA synthetase-like protein [Aspergillus sclerotiicarbonarius CBS 121057]|uniref:Acetyl-CoA synthetase-like protein n=1 Tax=Aspergillus sclerotiicarbonarius (strain CBS 121057 / IBT 28362) TaxID=1448318 RepID=A0A319EPG9_ASPSB|nr:acetyl-CoA synthetase-like protein [Aspergillus sclerotiicarbonarius CBS 121057]